MKRSTIGKLGLLMAIALVALVTVAATCESTPSTVEETTQTDTQRQLTEQAAEEARALVNKYGFSVEVEGIKERTERTNNPAHVEYVYVVSPMTGKIIMRAAAVGKTISRGKRLAPSQYYEKEGGRRGGYDATFYLVHDRVQPDGAYGSSSEGIYWFDTAGMMYEVNIGGAVVIATERPYVFADDTIDMRVDVRLQGQVDEVLDAQRVAIIDYISTHPDWRPGTPIPEEVLRQATSGENP